MPAPLPALATLTHDRVFRSDWLYERKLDGERCLATKTGNAITLHSRSGRDVTHSFPEVVVALADQETPDFVVDGEVVAFEGDRTSFEALQPRIHLLDARKALATGIDVYYYVFDLLELDGHDTRPLPLADRKALLEDVFDYGDPLRYTTHRVGADESTFDDACARGWEGLIAKRATARYPSGRSHDWLKIKCELGQEFVVGGFSDPQGSRTGFGALLLGYYRGDDFVYAGKVGSGFDHALLTTLHQALSAIERPDRPFTVGSLPPAGVHWVEPELVVQVAFTEWTKAGQLRHPRFVAVRRDKAADDVVRE